MSKKHKKYKKQRGGIIGTRTGVHGTMDTLVNNLFAVVGQTITTVKNTGSLISSVMNINTDLGQPYSANEYNAPGSNLT